MGGQQRKRLGEMLVQAQYISQQQLDMALANKPDNIRIGDYLIDLGFVTEHQLIEQQLGVPHVQLSQVNIDGSVLKLIPAELAKRTLVMPIRKEGNQLFTAMADPMDFFAVEEVRMATGLSIERSIVGKEEVMPLARDMKEAILRGVSPNELRELANEHGFLLILEDGAEKVLQGLTTVEELMKVAIEE